MLVHGVTFSYGNPHIVCSDDWIKRNGFRPGTGAWRRATQWEKGRADRLAGEPCKSANGGYLEGWYSVRVKGAF